MSHDLTTVLDSDAPAPIHDCWNLIGVEGNGTCRELVRYIHCRNCPVYSAAGLQLLDRPLPADYRRERAEHYAAAKQITQPARLSVVIFRLAGEWLALPTTAFQEVAERRVMHTLPHRRRGLALGLVNVRGELLICASVARLLGLESAELQLTRSPAGPGSNSPPGTAAAPMREHGGRNVIFDRLLVASWAGQRVAFPVDEVHGIHRFQKTELKDPPATISRSTLTYTQGVFGCAVRGARSSALGEDPQMVTVGQLDAESFFNALNRSLA